jgi:hypothetical protein
MVNWQYFGFSEREASFDHRFFERRGECVIGFSIFPNADREEIVSLHLPREKAG